MLHMQDIQSQCSQYLSAELSTFAQTGQPARSHINVLTFLRLGYCYCMQCIQYCYSEPPKTIANRCDLYHALLSTTTTSYTYPHQRREICSKQMWQTNNQGQQRELVFDKYRGLDFLKQHLRTSSGQRATSGIQTHNFQVQKTNQSKHIHTRTTETQQTTNHRSSQIAA